MPDFSRRTVAKGAAWSVPAIAVGAPAPALAASPCASIKAGSPLPASLFKGYFIVTNQTFGGVANKVDTFAAGVWLNKAAAAAACLTGSPTITSFALNTSSSGSMTLTNNKSYTVSGGSGVAGGGTLGTSDSNCTGPASTIADSCNTYTGNSLNNSTGTSSYNPKSAVLSYSVTVSGYGTTLLTFTVPSFTQDGTNWDGVNVSLS